MEHFLHALRPVAGRNGQRLIDGIQQRWRVSIAPNFDCPNQWIRCTNQRRLLAGPCVNEGSANCFICDASHGIDVGERPLLGAMHHLFDRCVMA